MLVGVLGLQGSVIEHVHFLRSVLNDGRIKIIKDAGELKEIDGLVIPGGESTTIGKLMQKYKLDKALEREDLPIMGTCAGAILLAKNISDAPQFSLGLMDMTIERNAYGRQRESFETEVEIPVLGEKVFKAVFIRAPAIKEVANGVEVLASLEGEPIMVRQNKFLACTFHPELADDYRVHEYFLDMIKE